MQDLFSPLGKDNCVFLYYVSVISFFLFLFVLGMALYHKDNRMKMLLASLSPLVSYYLYRILYSMCEKTL